MKFFWANTTQVAFGENVVKEYLPKYIKPKSRILITFGGGSIEKNGAKTDVQSVLEKLECIVQWEGGIPANPEFDRLVEIVSVVKHFKPDLILAVGGGSVLDGTKFIALASHLSDDINPWEMMTKAKFPSTFVPFGSIMTIPATGSEWNQGFVISRRSMNAKVSGSRCQISYPVFSLLDPKYTLTLPLRQLKNGLFDSFCHMMEQYLTSEEIPLFDNFWISSIKEVFEITPLILSNNINIQNNERLMMCALFGLNKLFGLGKRQCWAIHIIGHQLTGKYNLDHAITLALVMPRVYKKIINLRTPLLANLSEKIFNVQNNNLLEKAEIAIKKIEEFIELLEMPKYLKDCVNCNKNDIDELMNLLIMNVGNNSFGFDGQITLKIAKEIFEDLLL